MNAHVKKPEGPASEIGEAVRRDLNKLARAADRLSRTHGFKSLGEFCRKAAEAGQSGATTDKRLIRAPAGAGEVSGPSGGFLVPDEFADDLLGSLYDESVVLPLCDTMTAAGRFRLKLPAVDEKSRADGSRWGGAVAWWAAEADTVAASLPRWRQNEFEAKKLIAACVVSGELYADSTLLPQALKRAFAAEMGFKVDRAVLAGTGAGVPLGVINGPGCITIPKATGQSAGTLVQENVAEMWKRLPGKSRKRAVWLAHEDLDTTLAELPPTIYRPAGADGIAEARIYGRPVIPIEHANAPGAKGDFVLADLSQYMLLTGEAMQGSLSLDVAFVSDEIVFRFVWRLDGAPGWASPVTPYSGSIAKSPFVVLDART